MNFNKNAFTFLTILFIEKFLDFINVIYINGPLPNNIEISHVSLFDQSIQGISFKDKPAFSFQGHPEASPGPQDIVSLFKQFKEMIDKNAKKK